MAGLEVEEIIFVGLPMPEGKIEIGSGGHIRHETKISGIEWDPDMIVVGAITEVMPITIKAITKLIFVFIFLKYLIYNIIYLIYTIPHF